MSEEALKNYRHDYCSPRGHSLWCEEITRLETELASYRQTVSTEEEVRALAKADEWTAKYSPGKEPADATVYMVLARSLRAAKAALAETVESLKTRTEERDSYLEAVKLAESALAESERQLKLERLPRACHSGNCKHLAEAKERIEMAEFLVRGGDKDGALSVLRGGPIRAEKKS